MNPDQWQQVSAASTPMTKRERRVVYTILIVFAVLVALVIAAGAAISAQWPN